MNPLSNSKKTLEYSSIDNAEEFIPLLSPIEKINIALSIDISPLIGAFLCPDINHRS
jgi:hypothetical protein